MKMSRIKNRISEAATEACGYSPLTKVVSEEEINRILGQESGWIPVDERLPEKNGKYLVFLTNPVRNESDAVFAVWYNEFYKRFETESQLDKVIAWMPLPEPYRESEG